MKKYIHGVGSRWGQGKIHLLIGDTTTSCSKPGFAPYGEVLTQKQLDDYEVLPPICKKCFPSGEIN